MSDVFSDQDSATVAINGKVMGPTRTVHSRFRSIEKNGRFGTVDYYDKGNVRASLGGDAATLASTNYRNNKMVPPGTAAHGKRRNNRSYAPHELAALAATSEMAK